MKVNVKNNSGLDLDIVVNYDKEIIGIIIDKTVGNQNVILKDLKPGDVFSKAGVDYILLEHVNEDVCAVIRKELLPKGYNCTFGAKGNDWRCSVAKLVLNDTYLKELENDFGVDNIISHEIDLLSLDGLDDYGVDKVKVSLLTVDQYRKYRKSKVIGENMPVSWWLATPYSTPSGIGSLYVQCVRSYGDVGYSSYDWCNLCNGALRPFFHLKSNVLVERLKLD